MENVIAENLVRRALKEYEVVLEELNRPQEDLVMIAACESLKHSVADFLIAYLFERGVSANPDDLITLQRQCIQLDPAFEELDLTAIACLDEDLGYTHTLGEDRLKDYIATLEKTRELVLNAIGEPFGYSV